MYTLGHFEAGTGDDSVGCEGTTGPLQERSISMDWNNGTGMGMEEE